jgi:hypothetical protein
MSGRLWFWFVLITPFVLGGCGQSGPRTYEGSGTVTFDGQPLPEGDILFHAAGNDVASDAGKIQNGQFKFRAKAGPKRVEILAAREVPGSMNPVMGPLRENYIPAQYNTATTLTADVKEKGPNQFDYPLSKK